MVSQRPSWTTRSKLSPVGAANSANSSNTPSQIRTGRDLIRASILLQLGAFVCFVALEVVLHRRLVKNRIMDTKLRVIMILLYASSVLIMIRNIYRVVDVWQGYTGYLERHEAFFYVFDGMVMLFNSVMLNIWHPMQYLPRTTKSTLRWMV